MSSGILKNQIIEQLEHSLSGTPWFGPSILNVLGDITVHEANYRMTEKTKTIAEYLMHMLAWRTFIIEKIKGNRKFEINIDSSIDWPEIEIKSEKELEVILSKFQGSTDQLIHYLSEWQDIDLARIVPNKNYSYSHAINGLIHHDTYHLGQIVLIKKSIKM